MDREKQKDILKWMLGRAFRAENHKKQLKERLARIRQEMDAPYEAIKYDAMPRSQGNGDGAAALVIKLTEVEEKIVEQMKVVAEAEIRVMEIIEYIPIHEVARQILELRHIDMMTWYEIAEAIPMSRQQCSRKYKEALDSLLQYPEIQKKVEKAEPDYDAWISGRAKPKK